MTHYLWRDEASESLGRVKRPVAEVHLKDKNNIWRAVTMLIDSGADISVLSRGYGELFGHNVEKGRPIRLKSIQGTFLQAYIHNMEMLVGEQAVAVEVAISKEDDIRNVMGRKSLFDLFEIHFKNKKQETWFFRK